MSTVRFKDFHSWNLLTGDEQKYVDNNMLTGAIQSAIQGPTVPPSRGNLLEM